jgi:hypothetical protein
MLVMYRVHHADDSPLSAMTLGAGQEQCGRNIQKNSCRTTVLSRFGETLAKLPLCRGSGRLFRPRSGRLARGQKTLPASRARRRHVREKATIDHLIRDVYEPKVPDEKPTEPSPTTSTGLPVEDQVRKEWDPRKGGLPTFWQ